MERPDPSRPYNQINPPRHTTSFNNSMQSSGGFGISSSGGPRLLSEGPGPIPGSGSQNDYIESGVGGDVGG